MILHDYECTVCGKVEEKIQAFEDRIAVCSCLGMMRRIVSKTRRCQIDTFEPYHEESLGDDVPLITSNSQLARLCEERGLVSRRLIEGYKNHGRKREL